MMVASRQSMWRGEVKRPSHRLCRWIINWFKVACSGTIPWSRLSNFLCYGSLWVLISRYSGCKCRSRREKTVPSTNPDAEVRAADKAADPIGVDSATKPGAQPMDSVVYLDSVDAVKAPVDPVARTDELDPIDLLETTE